MKIMTREMSPIEQINRLKNNPAFAQYCKDKFYPESFRIDVVKLSLIPSIRVSTLSKELQIPMKIIYEWKNKYADSIKNQTTEKKEENVKWDINKEAKYLELKKQRELAMKNPTLELEKLIGELVMEGEFLSKDSALRLIINNANRFHNAVKSIVFFNSTEG